jgi:hypothetical protein
MTIEYNKNRYYVAESAVLPEKARLQIASDLRELAKHGVICWADDKWKLAEGVEVREDQNGNVIVLYKRANNDEQIRSRSLVTNRFNAKAGGHSASLTF